MFHVGEWLLVGNVLCDFCEGGVHRMDAINFIDRGWFGVVGGVACGLDAIGSAHSFVS